MGMNSTTKYLKNVLGTITEKFALRTSDGAADADAIVALNDVGFLDPSLLNATVVGGAEDSPGKIVQLDGAGKIDASLLPPGLGGDMALITCSEALAGGDLINVYSMSGDARVRKADGSTSGKEAHGFILVGAEAEMPVVVYFEGLNNQCTGLTPGVQYLSGTIPGRPASVAAVGSGKISQVVGFAYSETEMNFESEPPIVLA